MSNYRVERQVFVNAEWQLGKTKPAYFATAIGAINYAEGVKWLLTPVERFVVFENETNKILRIVEVME